LIYGIVCFDGCYLGYVKTEGDTKGSRPVVYECTDAKEYGRCAPETLSVLGHTTCPETWYAVDAVDMEMAMLCLQSLAQCLQLLVYYMIHSHR